MPGPDNEVATIEKIFHNYVYANYGHKKIASDLKIEGRLSPSGKQWGFGKEYVDSIIYNLENNIITIKVTISEPDTSVIILEKNIHISY